MFIKNLVLLVSRQVLSDMLSSNLSFGISSIHEANYWVSGSTLRIPGIWIIDHLNILGLDCTVSISVHRVLKCENCICRDFSIFILFLLFILEGFFNFCFHFVFLLHGCSRRFKARGKREISQPHNLEYSELQWLLHWELVALTQGEVGLTFWQRNRGFNCLLILIAT